MVERVLGARRASPADCELLTSIITRAFAADPLWSRALATDDGGTGHHARFWRLFIEGALRHPWTWLTGGEEAASVWIPPGATEMTSDQEEQLVDLAHQCLGRGAGDYIELLGRFERAHPRDEPHYYLSFLGTDPDHRGKGLGMALLAHTLELIDLEGLPAYLESSNPANDGRYASVGFKAIGHFSYPGGHPVVTTMWRPAR